MEPISGFELPDVHVPTFRPVDYNVRDYGARCDGALCTDAFEAAITACSAQGGGRVVVPAGCYRTGPIHIRSHVNLHLERGAFILFSRNYDDYPLISSYYEGYPSIRCTSPIWATDETDIAITGEGVLDGNGDAWWYVRRWEQTDEMWAYILRWRGGLDDADPQRHVWWPTAEHKIGSDYFQSQSGLVTDFEQAERGKPFYRPCMVEFIRCERILLEGVTLQNSPAWTIHPLLCRQITARHLLVKSPWDAPNTDGLNLECSQHAHVHDCIFDVGDDAICMKAGKNAAGRSLGVPTQDVHIHHCQVFAGHGGFVIGTETTCSIRNILVENCIFTRTDRGLRFKSCYGRGGIIENIQIRHIYMHNILKEAVSFIMGRDTAAMPADAPRHADGSFLYSPKDMPVFRGIVMEDIRCHGALDALVIRNLPGICIENVFLRDAYLEAKRGISSNGEGILSFLLENVSIKKECTQEAPQSFDSLLLNAGVRL